MVEIIKDYIDLSTSFINRIFFFEVEFRAGEMLPIGKIVTAFMFFAFAIYFILDALGILERGDD